MSQTLKKLNEAYDAFKAAEETLRETKRQLAKAHYEFCCDDSDGLSEGLITNQNGFMAYKTLVDYPQEESIEVVKDQISHSLMGYATLIK